MNTLINKNRILILMTALTLFISVLFITCGGDDDSNPEIVGCNKVKYKGYTYSAGVACTPGVASFDVTTTENGHTASFHITCDNGCIKTVDVINSSNQKVVSP